jgi:tetratricopeptide (TPR) repeat protein
MNPLGHQSRATATLEVLLPGKPASEALALDVEREYAATIRIQEKACGGALFRSPVGDEKWRDVIEAIRSSTAGDGNRSLYNRVFDAGRQLYEAIATASPKLRSFLEESGTPRRLVIASDRPEIHRLPWEAMIDSRRQNVAEGDLSVVHADQNGFDAVPHVAREALHLAYHFGPGTEESTRDALPRPSTPGFEGEERGLGITPLDAKELRESLRRASPDIVHIEAHGDHVSGTIRLTPDLMLQPHQLADLLGERLMVLFWSCYSGLVHSWGESPGLMLHRERTGLVLGFATPLQYKTSRTLAKEFYASVLDPRSGGDVESVLTRERARLFRDERTECVWASLTTWLRYPLDLSPAVKSGPRIPQDAWTDEALGEGDELAASEIAARIREAVAGKFDVVGGERLPDALPKNLVTGFPGAVVHLRGSVQTAGLFDGVLAALSAGQPDDDGVRPESTHPADTVLKLLELLSSYRSSLLLWSDISRPEIDLFDLIEELPANVAVLLFPREGSSTDRLIPGMRQSTRQGARRKGRPRSTKVQLEELERLLGQGDFREGLQLWRKLGDQAESWNREDPRAYLRYQKAGYWVFIKQGQSADAAARIDALEEACKALEAGSRRGEYYAFEFESRLLRANLRRRQARHDVARALYYEARELAREKENQRDVGRASLELAYVFAELGDRVLAEHLYRESIQLLGRAGEQSRDEVWRSALGRVLRDYADLIATEPDRSEEARGLLRRSTAIHAIDGRYDQLAAALRTRGRLAATEGRPDAAEASLEASAAICSEQTGNSAAWVGTMREMASLASSRGRHVQCRNILIRLAAFLEQEPDMGRDTGLVAMQLARTSWRLGQLDEVLRWCEQAERRLPKEMGRERRELHNLAESARSLGGTGFDRRQQALFVGLRT